MSERLIRLMRIVTLVQSKPGIMAKEIAERCETSERNIYRDIEALSGMSIPITNLGHSKGYDFVGKFSVYPLDWTEEEALAFSVLPSILERMKTLLPPGYESAYEKVMATHRREKSRQAEISEQVASIIQLGTPAHRENSANFLFPILQATLAQQTIEADYYTQSRDRQSTRCIDPYYLIPRENRFYVIGYDHSSAEIRTFRVSRFLRVEVLEQHFEKHDFDLHKHMKHTWSIERGSGLITFKVRFSPQIARYVKEEELFVKPTVMKDLPDGGLLFQVTVNHEREFLGWLAQYGPDAEILAPQSYRDVMRERLARWQALYAESGSE